jgi:hypothetical protein
MMLKCGATPAVRPSFPRFVDAGETVLVVEFGDTYCHRNGHFDRALRA